MDKYKLIKEVGDGTFGSVWRAINKRSGEIVAVKKMKRKYYSWEECVNCREVKFLRRLNHSNIIKLKEVTREHDICFIVFEYMESNLYQVMKDRARPFSEAEIRNWCFQIFQALSYMHQRGCFHRDLKPENLLVSKDIIKIADFGLAREISSEAPYTEYVSTRWYRAPEVLLQSAFYDPAVDMWAMGAIMAELFTLNPLFPGSSESDEMYKICRIIGSPDQSSWAGGLELADAMKYKFPEFSSCNLSELIPSASDDAVNLIMALCTWDPCKRPKAAEALQHPFFQSCFAVPPTLRHRAAGIPSTPPGLNVALDQKSTRRYSTGVLYAAKSGSGCSSAKPNALKPGMQKRIAATTEDHVKNARSTKNLNQNVYRTPSRNPGYLGRSNSNKAVNLPKIQGHTEMTSLRISNTAQKLGRLTVNSSVHIEKTIPSSMKAGGLHGQSNFLTRSFESTTTEPRSFRGKTKAVL